MQFTVNGDGDGLEVHLRIRWWTLVSLLGALTIIVPIIHQVAALLP